MQTTHGTAFSRMAAQDGPAPTLLLFAATGEETLKVDPFRHVGMVLHAQGWNVVSLDLPCHGELRRPGEPAELAGWAARLRNGENIVPPFQARVNDVLAYLIERNVADPTRIAAAGTSRGGFLAFHAAVGNPKIRAVAAFSPVTDLPALTEFAALDGNALVQQLSLLQAVDTLATRAAWITIGNADMRVDTDKAVAFARALAIAGTQRNLACEVTLRVLPTPGHTSHIQWHDDAAVWLQQITV